MANEFKVKNGLILASGALITSGSAGTSGYILTSNGSGSSPSWQANAGGGGGGSSSLVDITPTSITSSSYTTVYSASSTTYRAAKYYINITYGSNYGIYEFMVAHDGTSVYFPYSSSTSYVSGTYFSGDYLDSIATLHKIEIGTVTNFSLNWAVTGDNLVFSVASPSGVTFAVTGEVLLIKA